MVYRSTLWDSPNKGFLAAHHGPTTRSQSGAATFEEETLFEEDGYQREQDACESIGSEAEPHPPNGRGATTRVSTHETRMQEI